MCCACAMNSKLRWQKNLFCASKQDAHNTAFRHVSQGKCKVEERLQRQKFCKRSAHFFCHIAHGDNVQIAYGPPSPSHEKEGFMCRGCGSSVAARSFLKENSLKTFSDSKHFSVRGRVPDWMTLAAAGDQFNAHLLDVSLATYIFQKAPNDTCKMITSTFSLVAGKTALFSARPHPQGIECSPRLRRLQSACWSCVST